MQFAIPGFEQNKILHLIKGQAINFSSYDCYKVIKLHNILSLKKIIFKRVRGLS
jgi:hypothetical protein